MSRWMCRGCGSQYSQTDPDLITRHVAACDYVGGAAQEIEVTVKFSAVHWYIAKVKASDLAEASGGLPFKDLLGKIEDRDDEITMTELLTSLVEDAALDPGGSVIDGFDIGDLYDARRNTARLR